MGIRSSGIFFGIFGGIRWNVWFSGSALVVILTVLYACGVMEGDGLSEAKVGVVLGGESVHGDFEAAGGAREGAEPAWWDGLEGIIEAEGAASDADPARGEIGVQVVGGDIGDGIAEAIEVEDGAGGLVGGAARSGLGEADPIAQARSDFGELASGGEVGTGGGEEVASVEGVADRMEGPVGVGDGADGLDAVEGGGGEEEAVIGSDEDEVLGLDGDGLAGGADAGVDDGDVDGFGGKVWGGLGEEERPGANIAGWNLMADVEDGAAGGDTGDDAFHGGNEPVAGTEVGEQGNELHGN